MPMRGKLKFVDGKTGNWGFIIPDDGSPDLHFVQRDVAGQPLAREQAGVELEFDVDEGSSGRSAKRVRLVVSEGAQSLQADQPTSPTPAPIPEPRTFVPASAPGDELSQWTYLVFVQFTAKSGKVVSSDLAGLANMALEERWFFGATADVRHPFPILENYLKVHVLSPSPRGEGSGGHEFSRQVGGFQHGPGRQALRSDLRSLSRE
jgi:cold shock CspA family protein